MDSAAIHRGRHRPDHPVRFRPACGRGQTHRRARRLHLQRVRRAVSRRARAGADADSVGNETCPDRQARATPGPTFSVVGLLPALGSAPPGPRPGGSRRTGGAARCGRRERSSAPRSRRPGGHACGPRAGRRSATGWRPCHHAHRRCRHVRARRPCPRATALPAGRASGHAPRASGPGPPASVVQALPPCRGYSGLVTARDRRRGRRGRRRCWPWVGTARPARRQFHSSQADLSYRGIHLIGPGLLKLSPGVNGAHFSTKFTPRSITTRPAPSVHQRP
jgi:hypothetical protein